MNDNLKILIDHRGHQYLLDEIRFDPGVDTFADVIEALGYRLAFLSTEVQIEAFKSALETEVREVVPETEYGPTPETGNEKRVRLLHEAAQAFSSVNMHQTPGETGASLVDGCKLLAEALEVTDD